MSQTTQMRKLIESLNEDLYDATDPAKAELASQTKWQLADIVDQIEDEELRTYLWRAIHGALDDYAPGWDMDS